MQRSVEEWKELFQKQNEASHRAMVGSCYLLDEMPIKHEPAVWFKWVRNTLEDRGMRTAAEHLNKGNLYRYAAIIASDTLVDNSRGEPHYCIPEFLQGDAELTYWRAVAIYHETKPKGNQ